MMFPDNLQLRKVRWMNSDELTERIKAYRNEKADSDWYGSLRTDEKINSLVQNPASAFHPAIYELIRKYLPDLKGKRILLPSSGDNHAAFAFALLGGHVTSSDISERQLENASEIAKKLDLDIEFVCEDTMKLSDIPDDTYDLVYTSNGTLTWINGIDSMFQNVTRVLKKDGYLVVYDMHPFNRPFSNVAWKEPEIIKSYHDVFPDLHWRMEDIINSQIKAGLNICELAELPAIDASFWFTYDELKEKSPEELEGINDWKNNPMAALPAWMALISKKVLSS